MNHKCTQMSSKEIITRVIEHREAPRIGFDFIQPHFSDFDYFGLPYYNPNSQYDAWGRYPELLEQVSGFRGNVHMDAFGNIHGRLQPGLGEVIKGIYQDEWGDLEQFEFPKLDEKKLEQLRAKNYKDSDKFVVAYASTSLFVPLQNVRGLNNSLMDMLLEPELVEAFLEKAKKSLLENVFAARDLGANGLFLLDDWGMQHSLFISPNTFRELFQPVYKAVADVLHENKMKLFLHSCGLVWDIIPNFIEAGIDVLEFDQMELSGSENLAKAFGKNITIFGPVDIQKILSTGDQKLIEETARNMVHAFKEYANGSLIARDYTDLDDINIKLEWTDWARTVFFEEGWNE